MDETFFEIPTFDDAIDSSFFFDRLFDGNAEETRETIAPRAFRTRTKREMARMRQKEKLKDVVKRPPDPGEAVHVVAANSFNFWTWAPTIVEWLGHSDDIFVATWTTNHSATIDLFRMMDDGLIKGTAGFILGNYFKRREPVVYTRLSDGLAKRCGWIKTIETHCKVMLLSNESSGDYLSIEGSANLTDNPRLEQVAIINDRGLYEFHRDWMNEVKSIRARIPWA